MRSSFNIPGIYVTSFSSIQYWSNMVLISPLKTGIWPIRNVHPSRLCITNLLLNLHKTLNFDEHEPSFEIINVLDQLICTRRQIKFQIFRNSNCKIGFNTTANKFFYLNNTIGLELLNLNFIRLKKAAKIQFFKYGRT